MTTGKQLQIEVNGSKHAYFFKVGRRFYLTEIEWAALKRRVHLYNFQ